MKFGLGLHTTTGELGICLNNFEGKTKFNSWDLGRNLANNLHEYLAEFLQPLTWQDLEFIAVAKGPGSYTSTRIGIVTARTLAQQLNIPVYGISTLASLALYEHKKKPQYKFIMVEMKANNEQVFIGIYQRSSSHKKLEVILPEQLINLAEWQEKFNKYKEKFKDEYLYIKAPDKLAFTTPNLLELAKIEYQQNKKTQQFSTWEQLTPFY